ncbi:hypothetical protein EJ05DRAFT_504065 [Pseudovirgaria hyperparasitica]|uniref:C2H2-type domain-containing protein n=1 Tax=Pseudovirgaria hyperparasitica TaxID=470096 RepID=A0A6A6VY06_9PEZI|nr:uncharacterized protein EJ05DRAFT_504065 [Pseudovirgaria hyperparasitica]KAF2754530.1 hypothetical protein EJ05DRAFT_504065 [Pseudovirgaria hyperparasitica]
MSHSKLPPSALPFPLPFRQSKSKSPKDDANALQSKSQSSDKESQPVVVDRKPITGFNVPEKERWNYFLCRLVSEPSTGSAQWSSCRPNTHPDELFVECDECGSSLRYSEYEPHKNRHTIDRTLACRLNLVKCDDCGRTFSSQKAYKYHLDQKKCLVLAFHRRGDHITVLPRIEKPPSSDPQSLDDTALHPPLATAFSPTSSSRSALVLTPSPHEHTPLSSEDTALRSPQGYELITTASELTEASWEYQDSATPKSLSTVFGPWTEHIISTLIIAFAQWWSRQSAPSEEPCDTETHGKSSKNPASNQSSRKSATRRSKASSSSKRKARDDGQENEDGDDDGSQGPPRGNARPRSTAVGHRLACPFAKYDPSNHVDCLGYGADTIAHLKQHLFRNRRHLRPYHCPYCNVIFDNLDLMYAHMDTEQGRCVSVAGPRPNWQYISAEQEALLKPNASSSMTPPEQWHEIYRIIFPNAERPASVYVDHTRIVVVRDGLNEFLQTEGVEIARRTLAATGLQLDEAEYGPLLRDHVPTIFREILERCSFSRQDQQMTTTRPRRPPLRRKIQKIEQQSPHNLDPTSSSSLPVPSVSNDFLSLTPSVVPVRRTYSAQQSTSTIPQPNPLAFEPTPTDNSQLWLGTNQPQQHGFIGRINTTPSMQTPQARPPQQHEQYGPHQVPAHSPSTSFSQQPTTQLDHDWTGYDNDRLTNVGYFPDSSLQPQLSTDQDVPQSLSAVDSDMNQSLLGTGEALSHYPSPANDYDFLNMDIYAFMRVMGTGPAPPPPDEVLHKSFPPPGR